MSPREELQALRRLAELEAKAQGAPSVGVGEDVARAIPSAVAKGAANLAGAPADILEFLTSGGAKLASKFFDPQTAAAINQAAKPELPLPNSNRVRGGIESVTGPLYDPKTRAGKFVGGVVEAAAPGAPFGKGQAALGAVSGLASETAGAFTNDSPLAKGVAGVVAPVGAQLAHSFRSIPGQMIREATGDLTPQQLEQARDMIARAKAQGIDLMAPEALPPSSIQQLASDVIASKEGGRVMNRFLANRPEQVKRAVGQQMDAVAPQATPDASMGRARQAATDVIESAERARSAAVRPSYQAARQDVVPPENIQAIVSQIDDALPFMSPESRSAAEAFKQSLEGTGLNAAALDDLYKVTRNKIDLPAIGATSQEKTAAGALRPFNQSLDDSLKLSSDNLKTGREQYRQITENVIDPLTLNPVAAVSNEKLARPDSIKELYVHLNRQDPQAFPGLTRTWLENAFDESAKKIQAGENRMVGANFTKAVYGTPQQEANFLETMRGVAKASGKDADAFAKGAKNLMEILQATGKVAAAGSATGSRLPTNEMARRSTTAAGMEMISANPTGPVAKRLREWSMGSNYRKLAEVLTDPKSIDKIIQIGKYKPTTTTSMALAIGLLDANAEAASGR
jgi:hypothetical protein